MDGLRTRLIAHFSVNWPSTLDGFIRAEHSISRIMARDPTEGVDAHLPDPISAIVLGQDCHAQELLPSAFYELVRLPWSNGVSADNQRSVDTSRLSPNELIQYAIGRDKIVTRAREYAQKPLACHARWCHLIDEDDIPELDDDGDELPSPSLNTPCQAGVRRFWGDKVVPSLITMGPFDPLAKLEHLAREDLAAHGVCDGCARSVAMRLLQTRSEWWDQLGSDFGVPGVTSKA